MRAFRQSYKFAIHLKSICYVFQICMDSQQPASTIVNQAKEFNLLKCLKSLFLIFLAIKILAIAQFEKAVKSDLKFEKNFDPIASICLPPNQNIVNLQLNCSETHLIVLSCYKESESAYEYFLNIYDMQTISFSDSKTQQVF